MCESTAATYSINSQNQITGTQWSISPTGGAFIQTSSVTTALVGFLAPGTYILTATSFNPNQQLFTDSLIIQVINGAPNPIGVEGCYLIDSLTQCYQVCAGSTSTLYFDFQFEVTITGAESYIFIGGNGNIIEVTWGSGGNGSVSTPGQICSNTLCFEILPQPDANFQTNPGFTNDTLTVCKFQEILFENLSSNGLTYTWNFGDGSIANTFDATHTYTSEGFYTVILDAESICNCGASREIVVEVLPAPAPTLDCVNTVCPETRQRYTATTNGCTQFNWSISANGTVVNGGESADNFIEIIWHDGPEGLINLSVSSCSTTYCSYTNTFHIPIITPDGPITGDISACSGEVVTYKVPYYPGAQYFWTVGAGGSILGGAQTNAITVKWNDVNVVTPVLIESYYTSCFLGCMGVAFLNINITPEITITGDAHVCRDEDATIQAQAGFVIPVPADVLWHIENKNGETVSPVFGPSSSFTHTFSYAPGDYYWVATNSSSSYCTELIRQLISVTAIPDTPLGIEGDLEICPGQPVGFTIEEAGSFATEWTITDGASVTFDHGQSIQHTFGISLPYIVQAAHTDLQYPECASGSISITLSPATNLVISGAQDVCYNSIEAYTIPYINGSDYVWEIIPSDFGEIQRSDLNHVEIFWTQSGAATLRLHTCGTVIDKNIVIHPLPAFNVVGPLATCANEMVSLSTDQPSLSHMWRDENDAVVSITNTAQFFPGTYSVEVTDALGCSDKKPFTINTYPAPSVYVTSPGDESYCTTVPAGVELVANTDGDGYVFEWFKDDVSTGFTGATYTVTQFGTYYVTVVNQYGCTAASPKITIFDCCPVSACAGGGGAGLPGSGCNYQLYDFLVMASGPECPIRQYIAQEPNLIPGQTTWVIRSISEGVIGVENVDVLNHTYTSPGYYHLTILGHLVGYPYNLTDCGHIQPFTDTIRAVADFHHTGICAGDMVQFEDLTTFLPGETIADWHWNFGDPASGAFDESHDQDPLHAFAADGDYTVTLIVTMASGCTTSKSAAIHISAGPVLSPVYDPVYCEDEAYSLSLPGQVYDVNWDFGDPASGILNQAFVADVFHTYDNQGIYTATVSAADVYGCRSQAPLSLDIRQNTLIGNILVVPSNTVCYGDTATLIAPAGGISWNWNTGEMTTQIEVASTDNYTVLVSDAFHCTYSPPAQFITVLPRPNLSISGHEILGQGEYGSWKDTLHICEGTEFQLQAFFEGSISLQWSHGPTDPVLEFTEEAANIPSPGLYEYSVIGINGATGCASDTAFYIVEIYSLPAFPLIALVSGSGCGFDDNTLQVTNPQAGVEYHWSDGQSGTSVTIKDAGTYYVTATNQNGCETESNRIMINASAPVDQIPGGCHISCDPLTVCLPPIANVTSWTIYQNGVVYLSGTVWPSDYIITSDGSYTIEVTTTNGCTAISDPLDISLYPGVGSITILTYQDVDGDGLITAADLLLSGIPVQIESMDGLQHGETYTESGGSFVFEDYPASTYTASFNLALLSSQWKVVIDSVSAQIVTCGDSIIVSLLLMENCIATGPDQTIESCPGEVVMYGDSIWSDTGFYEVHLLSALGCDSIFNVHVMLDDTIEISATVWVDVDQDGVISPADTTIQGITIVIDEGINHAPFIVLTDGGGNVFGEFTPGNYSVSVDSTILPQGLSLLYGLDFVSDTLCGMAHFNFLLSPSCADLLVIQQQELCVGDSILIQGQWIYDAGVYSFLLSQPGSGCDTTLDVHVTLLSSVIVSGITDWDCIHLGSIDLTVQGTPPFQYFWSPNVQGDTMVTGLQDGTYIVTVVDADGCSVSDTFTIIGSPSLSFSLLTQYDIHPGDSVEVMVTGDVNENGLHFQWFTSSFLSCDTCSATWAFPDTSTIYSVLISDADSCVYDLSTYISVTFDSSTFDRIYVPNVFSPNGDGINDRWTIYSRLDNTYVHSLYLFDRWGQMLFYKGEFLLNTFDGWDGVSRGQKLSAGVYAYVAELTLGDGTKRRVKGDVTLLR
ncbi:MAG: PKD domain-containing protein [Saprospiraceae bacterium]